MCERISCLKLSVMIVASDTSKSCQRNIVSFVKSETICTRDVQLIQKPPMNVEIKLNFNY